jgi:hypothetical protein
VEFSRAYALVDIAIYDTLHVLTDRTGALDNNL